jgi:membrane protein YqaA with SNARE-associated domain
MFGWNQAESLGALFAAAFVSATVLPANSEVVLAAFLRAFPASAATAIAVATLGNTLGGLTTYGLGRLVPARYVPHARALAWVRRYGAMALLLSWVPLVGDALCAAAGWLRGPVWAAALAMAAGKLARYVAVAQAVAALQSMGCPALLA